MARDEKKSDSRKECPRKKKGMKSRDYAPIRAAYVEGIVGDDGKRTWPTMQEVAERFGCPAGGMRQRAAKEKWTEAKDKFKAHLEQETRSLTLKRLASEAADFDLAALKAAKAGVAECTRHFIRMGKVRQLDPDATYTEKELEAVGRALTSFHKTGRLALGEPTDSTENRNLGENEKLPSEVRRRKIGDLLELLGGEEL